MCMQLCFFESYCPTCPIEGSKIPQLAWMNILGSILQMIPKWLMILILHPEVPLRDLIFRVHTRFCMCAYGGGGCCCSFQIEVNQSTDVSRKHAVESLVQRQSAWHSLFISATVKAFVVLHTSEEVTRPQLGTR